MMEVSVVIPCLNEEKTITPCIKKAQESFRRSGLKGEVIVVDNGSTDRSAEIAASLGARVIAESRKGYGSALRRGIEEAAGTYIIMGDGDNTYDFTEADKFVALLKQGYDLVMGSRFRGKILLGAMTWSHRYIGNPILSGILRIFFGGGVSDSHCGLRAFTKEAYKKMDLHADGMEFASEMVIHALKKKVRIAELPIIYYPREGESKLSSFRDAWRHMRFMLLYSPNHLFLLPGFLAFTVGFLITIRFLFGPIEFAGRRWDIHVMVFSSLLAILGWEILNLGVCAKIFAHRIGLEESRITSRVLSLLSLERSIVIGLVFLLFGTGFAAYIIGVWIAGNFGELAQVKTGIVAMMLIALGIQTIFAAFLTSMLQIRYSRENSRY